MKKNNSLQDFMLIVDKNPEIGKFIISKTEHTVEIHLPLSDGNTWLEQSEVLRPLFEIKIDSPIKKHTTSFVEKHNYFKILINLK